jgi:hypothetical protein
MPATNTGGCDGVIVSSDDGDGLPVSLSIWFYVNVIDESPTSGSNFFIYHLRQVT